MDAERRAENGRCGKVNVRSSAFRLHRKYLPHPDGRRDAALAREWGYTAESAGVSAQRSDGAAPFAARALRMARGLDLSDHTPQDVASLDLSAYDVIVAMAPNVTQQLRTEHDVPPDRLVTWTIPDPYGGTMADYRYCLEQIDTSLDRLLSS